MPVDNENQDPRFYKMNHCKRGLALIFNHEIFSNGSKARSGTDVDCATLKKSFERLLFEVRDYHDLTYTQLWEKVKEATEYDHSNSDCIAVAVLTHGSEDGILFAKDAEYNLRNLLAAFHADKCKSLDGKPKMFFIQACQGENLDCGIMMGIGDSDSSVSIPVSQEYKSDVSLFTMPHFPDFLIAQAAVPGFISWRNTIIGSWFIQALCHELNENGFTHDLLRILTAVNHRVAVNYETHNPKNPQYNNLKQSLISHSTLRRLVKFINKPLEMHVNEKSLTEVKHGEEPTLESID